MTVDDDEEEEVEEEEAAEGKLITAILYTYSLLVLAYTPYLLHSYTQVYLTNVYIDPLLSPSAASANPLTLVPTFHTHAHTQRYMQMSTFKKYALYIQLQFNIPLSALLICQALVLAWKLDDSCNTYDWGIVFLPVWVYLLVQYAQSIYYSEWRKNILRDIDYAVVCMCVFCILYTLYTLLLCDVYDLLLYLPFIHMYTLVLTPSISYAISHLPAIYSAPIWIYTRGDNPQTASSRAYQRNVTCILRLYMYTIIYVNLINIEIRISCTILCVYDVITRCYTSGVLLMYGTTGLVFDVVGAALGTYTAYEVKKGC